MPNRVSHGPCTEQGGSRTNRMRPVRGCPGGVVLVPKSRAPKFTERRAVEGRDLLSPTRRGTATSFTGCCGGPGTPWPCQARGCGRNIENFDDGQELPKLRAGCSSHPGGTNSFPRLTTLGRVLRVAPPAWDRVTARARRRP